MPPESRTFDIKRWRHDGLDRDIDTVAIEEPLAIRIQHWRKQAQVTEGLAITMRTPGADRELAAGLLLTEGIILSSSDIVAIRPLGIEPNNELLVELAQDVDFESWRQQRNGLVSSSCGVCGKGSVEQMRQMIPPLLPSGWRLTSSYISALPELMNSAQSTFNRTGGVHAAALVSLDGKLQSLFEDIGRHNALDKVLGHATLNNRLPLSAHVLFMSSRSSFELIQKAAMAGVQMLASVGGPSSLAIDTARQLGLTLICFVRDERFNVYSGEWRLDL